MIENEKGGPKMAIKFSKTDDLDKWLKLCKFSGCRKEVEFPEEKKKAETATTKEAKKAK